MGLQLSINRSCCSSYLLPFLQVLCDEVGQPDGHIASLTVSRMEKVTLVRKEQSLRAVQEEDSREQSHVHRGSRTVAIEIRGHDSRIGARSREKPCCRDVWTRTARETRTARSLGVATTTQRTPPRQPRRRRRRVLLAVGGPGTYGGCARTPIALQHCPSD